MRPVILWYNNFIKDIFLGERVVMSNREAGLTIPELMLGLLLFSILVSMAAPSFQNVMRKQELRSQTSLLSSTLAYARNEAITRKQNVAVCGSLDGASCQNGAVDWSAGWMVFTDLNDNRTFDVASEEILRAGGDIAGQASLRVVNGAGGNVALVYNESGEREDGVSELRLCAGNAVSGADTERSRTITVNNVGSSRVAVGATCP